MSALQQFVASLRKTEWMAVDELHNFQQRSLEKLIRHAYATVPFYRDRLSVLFRTDEFIDWDRWTEIKLMSKADIRNQSEELLSQDIPANHGAVESVFSSGSTGEPVETKETALTMVAANAVVARLHDWHGIDRDLKLAAIRSQPLGVAEYPHGQEEPVWAKYADYLECQGSYAMLNVNTPLHLQAEWLARECPAYLHSYPNNAGALAALIAEDPRFGPHFALKGLLTFGEIVSDAVRDQCKETFGVELADNYSAHECHYLALQCPSGRNYHIQSEVNHLEILNDDDQPCAPGELGRVVVTTIYNFAMPLIRYEMNDHAVPGEPCACGRALPTLERVVGRSRNLFRFPDGTSLQPDFKPATLETYLGPKQWQVAQTGPLEIEVRLVPKPMGGEMDFDGMTAYIHSLLSDDLNISYRLMEEIPVNPGGKHEDYVCELSDAD